MRQEVIIEGVGPEEDRRATRICRLMPSEPVFERFGSEGRNSPLERHTGDQFGDIAKEWKLRREVRQARGIRCQPGPKIDVAEGVGTHRPPPPFVVVGEELRLVGCDVDANRAIALTTFAGEAQVKRILDMLILPPFGDDFTLRHLPEQVGTTASRMLLFVGYAIARTHNAAFRAAALANSDTTQSGTSEAAMIFLIMKVSRRRPGFVIGPQAKILVHAVGLDQISGIHLPLWVPSGLKLSKSIDQFRTEHLGKKFGTGQAIAMFAGE